MIPEGLLWFDNDPQRKLADKISRAATRYQAKFGRRPTICYVNTTDFDGDSEALNGIRLCAANNILPHHFWIGVEKENGLVKAA